MKAFTLPTVFTAVDKFTSPVSKMNEKLDRFSKAAFNVSKGFAIAGTAIIAPMALMANEAIKFEDKLADISKTTGMQGKALEQYGDFVLDLAKTTRTSIDDILKIGEIGGQLGVVEKDLPGFTTAVNKFNVALGSDFQGGVEEAAASVSKIQSLFKDTRNLNVADSINKVGSTINELGAVGNATSANITDFTLRIGALPDAIKPTIQDTQALASLFEEAGITSEIAARGFSDLLLGAGTGIGAFAKQMGMAEAEAKKLFESDPTTFATKFAKSLNKLSATELANKLHDLKIGDAGTIKVVGALSTGTERLATLQGIANKAFKEGISLNNEYAKKNETTAAKLKIAQNNFQALFITIGTELLPIIGDLVKEVVPIIKHFTKWAKDNKSLVKTLAKVALFVGGAAFAISGIAFAIGVYTKALMIVNVVQTAFNSIMAACPLLWIGLTIAAVIAGIYLLYKGISLMIESWDTWGASIAFLLGPLGFVISLIMSFKKNWDMITKAFKENGVLSGLLAIGKVLMDAVLMPLEQIVSIIGDITGAQWAKDFTKNLHSFRAELGLNVGDENKEKEKPAAQSAAEQEREIVESSFINNIQRQQTTLTIDNRTGYGISTKSDNNLIDVMTKSTMKYGQ